MSAEAQLFYEETIELVEDFEAIILEIEKSSLSGNEFDNNELINRAFRKLHTIKGSGAIINFSELVNFVQEIESAFDKIRNKEAIITKPFLDLALQACDIIHDLVKGKKVDCMLQYTVAVSLKKIIS